MKSTLFAFILTATVVYSPLARANLVCVAGDGPATTLKIYGPLLPDHGAGLVLTGKNTPVQKFGAGYQFGKFELFNKIVFNVLQGQKTVGALEISAMPVLKKSCGRAMCDDDSMPSHLKQVTVALKIGSAETFFYCKE